MRTNDFTQADHDIAKNHLSKGTVQCQCESCGHPFFRDGRSIVVKTSKIKDYPFITEKKIIDACKKGDIGLLKPQSESDVAMMKIHLCDMCLYGFRKPQSDEDGKIPQ